MIIFYVIDPPRGVPSGAAAFIATEWENRPYLSFHPSKNTPDHIHSIFKKKGKQQDFSRFPSLNPAR
jgi:hypothetical protein